MTANLFSFFITDHQVYNQQNHQPTIQIQPTVCNSYLSNDRKIYHYSFAIIGSEPVEFSASNAVKVYQNGKLQFSGQGWQNDFSAKGLLYPTMRIVLVCIEKNIYLSLFFLFSDN